MDSYKESEDQWEAFSLSLLPITGIFGKSNYTLGNRLNKIIVALAMRQADVLLFGKINGTNSPNLKKLSGIPYLSGDDTWIDLPRMFSLPLLQPDKIHFRENNDPDWIHVIPLLKEMENVFSPISQDIRELLNDAEYLHQNTKNQKIKVKSEKKKKRKNTSKNMSKENKEKKVKVEKLKNLDNCKANEKNYFKKFISTFGFGNSNIHCSSSSLSSSSPSSSSPSSSSPFSSSPSSSSLSSTSTSSSSPTTSPQFINPSLFNIVENDFIVVNQAGLEILRELSDCIQLLSLRATHVRLLYESRTKPKPSPAVKTGLQKAARDLLTEATEIGETDRQTHTQTVRQIDTQTDRQTSSQTNR